MYVTTHKTRNIRLRNPAGRNPNAFKSVYIRYLVMIPMTNNNNVIIF